MTKRITQTAGSEQLGTFAPTFAAINDDVLFGEVWQNETFSLRELSLFTVTSLIAQGITDTSLRYHLETAKKNGVTQAEIAGLITHIAFYCGWPKAWAAFGLAKTVWSVDENNGQPETLEAFKARSLFPVGEANDAYAQYFTGQSYLAMLNQGDVVAANVTFEPGARNHWHTHHGADQILLCVAGTGWYQEEGKPAQALKAGDTVRIPAGVKHWHGASATSWFSHIALQAAKPELSVTWAEPVRDEDYQALHHEA